MDELTAFVTARLDEDETAPDVHGDGCALHAWLRNDVPSACDCGYPARVLREVAAKRAILAAHAPLAEPWTQPGGPWCATCGDAEQYSGRDYPCSTIRAIAAIWSDHPDYQQVWGEPLP